MREILFRGKRIDNGEWVYGFYFCMYHDDDREHLHHFILPLNVSIPKDRPIGEIQVEVDPDTVGQCVSDLPDKNGKKIFEGDIVSDGGFSGIVVFDDKDDGAFLVIDPFAVDTDGEFFSGLIDREVVGNIHDDPELSEIVDEP